MGSREREREDLWMDHAGNRDRRRDDSDADMRRFSSTEEAKRRYNCGSPRHREDRRKILAVLGRVSTVHVPSMENEDGNAFRGIYKKKRFSLLAFLSVEEERKE